jgi:hypothetical protein
MNFENKKKDSFAAFLSNLYRFFKGFYMCSHQALKRLASLSLMGKINLTVAFLMIVVWSLKNTHFWLLHLKFPEIFSDQFVRDMGMAPVLFHLLPLVLLYFLVVILILGAPAVLRMRTIEKALAGAGLMHKESGAPQVLDMTKLTPEREVYNIRSYGVPLSDFEKRKDYIRSTTNSYIEAIDEGSSPQKIDLYLTKKLLPKKLKYSDVCGSASKSGDFVVGEAHGKLITQNIFELPHMLVAGTTGMGKSYFLRQMTMNLIENTPNLQVYALDFKQGVSFKVFKSLPNVEVIKDMGKALEVLKKVKQEMQARFDILENGDDDVIDLKKHKKDPILIVVDECSMLYGASKTSKIERELALEATQITDELAKLSRAARINLVLGTQKISKETISTNIQENIDGRLCFKVATVSNSAIVIGTKAAKDIPSIAGRAISKFSVYLREVQTPLLETSEIKTRCAKVKADFNGGKRSLNQAMVSEILLHSKVKIDASDEGDLSEGKDPDV